MEATRVDQLVAELQLLRRAAGEPSYAEIARRIAEQREAAGLPPHAARIARTTVYDVFRAGRTRLNVDLVREVVRALGGDDSTVDAWLVAPPVAPGTAPEAASETGPESAPAPPPPVERPRASVAQVLLLMAACVAANLLGRALVDLLQLPVYLDMVGTAVAAIALGPWRGAAVGATTNLLGVVSSGPDSVPFALVNVVGALVWGYGVRRGLGATLPRFLSLNVLVAAACSLVAVPLLLVLYGGSTGHGEDVITDSFLDHTETLLVATGLSNVLVSIGDKLISGFVALVAVSALPDALRRDVPLPLAAAGRPAPSGSR